MMTEIEEAAKAEEAVKKKNPDHIANVALIDRYIAQYPAAQKIRSKLVAAKAMDSGKIADAVRKFMDDKVGE